MSQKITEYYALESEIFIHYISMTLYSDIIHIIDAQKN